MSCQEMRELFSARIDDALGAGERARLDAHLATCAECRREWQRFEATVGLLRAVEPVRAPAGFVDRVLAATQPVPWYRRLARGLLVPWTVKLPVEAAALLLIGGLAVLIFQRSPEMQHTVRAPEIQQDVRAPETRHAVRATEPPPVSAPQPSETLSGQEPAAKDPAPKGKNEVKLEPAQELQGFQRDYRQEQVQAGRAAEGVQGLTTAPESKTDQVESRGDRGAKMAEETMIAGKRQREIPAMPPPVAQSRRAPTAAGSSATAPPAAPSVAQGVVPSAIEPLKKERAADAAAKAAPEEPKVGALNLARSQVAARVAPADVDARLTVADLVAAEREIIALLARLGAEVVRQGDVFELTMSREAFAELLPALARLGDLRTERRPAELPPRIRVTLRLVS